MRSADRKLPHLPHSRRILSGMGDLFCSSMIRMGVLGLAFTASSHAAPPASRPAVGASPDAAASLPKADLASLKQEAASQLEARLRPLTSIGTVDVLKVAQFSIVDNDLDIRTQMPTTRGAVRLKLDGIPGEASLSVRQSPVRGITGVQSLTLIHEDTARADVIDVRTQIFASPQYLQIARDIEKPGEDISISLIQNLPARMARMDDPDAEGAVKFYVRAVSEEGAKTTVDIKLSADNITELIRAHPREMATYFEPIMRDLHQASAIFGIEPAVAWQVFATEIHADPAMNQKIQALVRQLGARRIADRQAAVNALRELGPAAAVELMHLDRHTLSPEQNARIDELLVPYQTLSAEQVKEMRNSPAFLLNCLDSTDTRLRHIAFTQLKSQTAEPLTFDADANPQTRARQIERLRAQLLKASANQVQ